MTPGLHPELESALMSLILRGLLDPGELDPKELSKTGRTVLAAAVSMLGRGVECPLDHRPLARVAIDVAGGDPSEVKRYLQGVTNASLKSPTEVLALVRNKQLLVRIINEAGRQLSTLEFDPGVFGGFVGESGTPLAPLSEVLGESTPTMPVGTEIKSLPVLSERSGGIFGVWAIAGAPGVGKSALAEQIALDVGQRMPVLLYDFENGTAVLLYRAFHVFGRRLADLGTRIFLRESIRTLDADLVGVPPPALVIVDSVQKLPASVEYRRTGLERWVHRLEGLKKRGYHVLLVSEVGRSHYGSDPSVGAFKETGEIEYSADLGIQLVEAGDESSVEVHIVKNRHHAHRGLAVVLHRVKDWWFREGAVE